MTAGARDPLDPRRLVAEAYAMEGIDAAQCRSVFLDWLMGLPAELDQRAAIEEMLARHGRSAPDHPMTAILSDGLAPSPPRQRRGRRR